MQESKYVDIPYYLYAKTVNIRGIEINFDPATDMKTRTKALQYFGAIEGSD
jgi:hypothetical protein